jgi:4-amino-4-deoxy-L-arabinose transferase-like glycosyltransferase
MRVSWRSFDRAYLILAALVAILYLPRLAELPTRGEETRWARVADEMRFTGDWIVPRQQGEPFLSRPPLGSWLMAVAGAARGRLDLYAVRLPTFLATLALSIGVYSYLRTVASRTAALCAALAFAVCPQTLQLTRLAETDLVFSACVAGSLLAWHALWRSNRPCAAWMAGYTFAAAAGLAKGLQGPAFFVASIGLYLLVARELKALLRLPHFVGVAAFLLVFGGWNFALYFAAGPVAVKVVWTFDIGLRFVDRTWATFFEHLAAYPLELVSVFMPWSLAFLAAFRLSWRRIPSPQKSTWTFLVCCIAATFPAVLLTPGAKVRYYLPLFPILAGLTGLFVDGVLAGRFAVPSPQSWRMAVRVLAVVLSVMGVVGFGHEARFGGLSLTGVLFCGLAAVALAALWRAGRSFDPFALRRAGLAAAVALGALHSGPWLDLLIRRSLASDQEIAALLEQTGTDLVSFGPLHHRFTYYYGKPLPWRVYPARASDVADGQVFCFMEWHDLPRVEIPFAWERIGEICCDRNVKSAAEAVVVVGRKLPIAAVRASSPVGN